MKVIADGFSTVVAAVAQAGYDFTKVSPDSLATLQSPEFANSAAPTTGVPDANLSHHQVAP